MYPAHLSMAEMVAGLQTKTLVKGVLRCKGERGADGYVIVQGAGQARQSVSISGASSSTVRQWEEE